MRRALRCLLPLVLAVIFGRVGVAADLDYGRPEAWLARPGLASTANLVPRDSGYSNLEASARADVFYLHPTTGMRKDVLNVPIDDPQAVAVANTMLMAQATPFNGVARIYAPRYRQVALPVFDNGESALQQPMNHAYEDVRRAFAHYATHDNDGRPFFLVAHSQGSNHALRLLMEEIQGTPLQARLIAAYLPGMPTPRSVLTRQLARIPLCARAEQIGCVAVWGVFSEDYRDFRAWEAGNQYWDASVRRWHSAEGMDLANVNPVSWNASEVPTPRALHQGAVPFGVAKTHFSRPIPNLVSARTEHGYTLVSPVPLPAGLFDDGGVFDKGNYHVFDINLFWADLRANARRRLTAFLMERERARYPVIESPGTATAIAGQSFRIQLVVHNGPARFRADHLPAGLQLDPATGEIFGTPAAPGRHAAAITAVNAVGSYQAELALTVEPGSK